MKFNSVTKWHNFTAIYFDKKATYVVQGGHDSGVPATGGNEGTAGDADGELASDVSTLAVDGRINPSAGGKIPSVSHGTDGNGR
jgi:hypothetical protein